MERNPINSSRAARFTRRAKVLIHDWSFPLVLVLVWSLAASYTLVVASRQPTPAQGHTIVAPPPKARPVAHLS